MREGIMMVPESAGVCCKTRGHEMKEVLTRKRRTSFLKWIVHKMHWTEDWGHHELPDKRGPLTAPEKHDHQPPTTNQQPINLCHNQKKCGLATTQLTRRLEGMENVDETTALR